MKVTVIPIIIGALGTVTKRLIQGHNDLEIRGVHPNYSIIKIGQNTEKSPGNLRRLAITQTVVRNHWLTLVWKTGKEVNNDNNDKTGGIGNQRKNWDQPDHSIVKIS